MSVRASPRDPRPTMPGGGEAGILPVVGLPRAGPSRLVLGTAALAAGLILFSVLDARRRTVSAPSVRPGAAEALDTQAPPPPLYIPRGPPPPAIAVVARPVPPPAPLPRLAPPPPQIVYVPQPAPPPYPSEPQAALPPPPRSSTDPTLVVDTTAAPGALEAGAVAADAAAAAGGAAVAGARSRAGVLANRATTISQGTLVPAVMETAFNSTRPGFARAIVSRDVRGFDGSRVLIPRGSRLIGEYRSDAAPGQKRALVNWVRLIRPDGVTIAIGSPATDPLGRGGIRAKVNSHFFERFASAILKSTVDVGLTLAARAGNAPVILALPGALQNGGGQVAQPAQIVPTLTVRAGTSISIFVARDLDFTGVENRR